MGNEGARGVLPDALRRRGGSWAAAAATRTRHDRAVVERREGDAARRRRGLHELRVRAGDLPCHCTRRPRARQQESLRTPAQRTRRDKKERGEALRRDWTCRCLPIGDLVAFTLVALLQEYPGTPTPKRDGSAGPLSPSWYVARLKPPTTIWNAAVDVRLFCVSDDSTAAPAAAGDLVVVRRAGGQVHDDRLLLAAMRPGGATDPVAVALLRRLRARHAPDDLVASPPPAQPPPGLLDVAVQLVIVDAHHDLHKHRIYRLIRGVGGCERQIFFVRISYFGCTNDKFHRRK